MMIEVRDLHKSFGTNEALKGIDITIERGEKVVVIGPSGCGKTSILSMIDGLMQPSRGRINLYGKSRPGYMLQRDHLLDWRTVEGNVLLGLQVKGMLNEETRAFTNSLLKTYGLSDFAKSYPRQLSGGMRRRVAILRALLCGADVIFLDEPFKGLDEVTKALVVAETKRLCAGKTVLLVTHEEKEAAMMGAKQVVRMEMDVKNTSV